MLSIFILHYNIVVDSLAKQSLYLLKFSAETFRDNGTLGTEKLLLNARAPLSRKYSAEYIFLGLTWSALDPHLAWSWSVHGPSLDSLVCPGPSFKVWHIMEYKKSAVQLPTQATNFTLKMFIDSIMISILSWNIRSPYFKPWYSNNIYLNMKIAIKQYRNNYLP